MKWDLNFNNNDLSWNYQHPSVIYTRLSSASLEPIQADIRRVTTIHTHNFESLMCRMALCREAILPLVWMLTFVVKALRVVERLEKRYVNTAYLPFNPFNVLIKNNSQSSVETTHPWKPAKVNVNYCFRTLTIVRYFSQNVVEPEQS